MNTTQNAGYKDLIVWKKGMDLVVLIYEMCNKFPIDEKFALSSQMKRASVSIVSNIAEGSKRGGKKEFKNFLSMAYGSGAELETQLEIARRLDFISDDKCYNLNMLLGEIMRMLNSFINKLK